jgi:hypothetical protein
MKKVIITEEEKSRILNMHKSISANHYLMEQGSLGAFSGGTFSGGTPMDKEIIALEELKTQLEKTKKELEFKKQVVGGTTIDRIRNYFRIRKIRKENQTLEIELKQLERDIKDLESGKVLTSSQKEAIVGTIGGIITGIGVIVAQMKKNIGGKIASVIQNSIDPRTHKG